MKKASDCTDNELREVLLYIDRKKYPERYEEIKAEVQKRGITNFTPEEFDSALDQAQQERPLGEALDLYKKYLKLCAYIGAIGLFLLIIKEFVI
jgi:hypothetical protein